MLTRDREAEVSQVDIMHTKIQLHLSGLQRIELEKTICLRGKEMEMCRL